MLRPIVGFPFSLKGNAWKKTLFSVCMAFLIINSSHSQTKITASSLDPLRIAYDKIKTPEISFERFKEINSHVITKPSAAKTSAVAAAQDTYCANVRTYCENGTFESGLDQTQWTGAYGFDYSGITPNPFTLTYGYSSGSLFTDAAHQTIVNIGDGNDYYVPIPQVGPSSGTKALRLGNAVNGNGTEVLAKTIVVSANETILKFSYAVVFEDPGHAYNDQPAFSVRAYDCATGLELPGVCNLGNNSNVVVSNASNPFFQSAYSGAIAYRDWSQAQIDLSAHVGKKVVIIFENKDCNLGGHFGYTYLDNIFSNLCPLNIVITGQGSIALNTAATSTCGTGQICATYALPTSTSATGTINISLDIYQAGVKVTTLTSGVLSSGTSYCFNINPATLGLNNTLNGFDYALTGNFVLSGFALSPSTVGNPPNGQIAGANNDYLIACPPPTVFYSKAAGGLHTLATWGTNLDGTGTAPTDFGSGKTFNLANRAGVYTLTADWTVEGLVVNPAGSALQINGFAFSEAGLSGTGTLTGSATSNLVVGGTAGGDAGALNFTSGGASLNSLTLNRTGASASATIGSTPLSLFGVLTVTNGTLNTNNILTLKSSASNTARVAPVAGVISGNVTVERYVPARRAWRILSAPVGGLQTINQSMQEGAVNTAANPVPNFGTFITGGTAADGFDQNPGATSSIKTYNSGVNNWVGVPNTNATTVGGVPYMTFVFGNRNNNTISVGSTPGNTTLRATGPLKTGNQLYPVNATGFTSIPNPFASPINFATITRSGVANTFYLWDPKVGGANGVGAYVTVSFNGSTYDVSANAVSPESQYIQSGQGFLVYPLVSGTAGSVTIKESDKSATAATDVFRTVGGGTTSPVIFQDPTKGEGLRMNLQTVNPDGTSSIVDEIFTSYKAEYSNKVDGMDAVKATNMGENLGIEREGQTLVIERRALPKTADTISLKLWNTGVKKYMLQINPINLAGSGLTAYLRDSYLNTAMPVSLSEISQVSFSINSDKGSARGDRFSIILTKNIKEEPVTLNGITAFPNPFEGRNLNLQFTNQPAGTYLVTLLNSAGKVMLERSVQHVGGSAIQALPINNKLPTGFYKLQIKGKDAQRSVQILSR